CGPATGQRHITPNCWMTGESSRPYNGRHPRGASAGQPIPPVEPFQMGVPPRAGVRRLVAAFSGSRAEFLAGLLAAMAGDRADFTVGHVRTVTFAFRTASLAGRDAGLELGIDQRGVAFGLTRQDLGSGFAHICAILAKADAVPERLDLVFAQAGVGAGHACLAAGPGRRDALDVERVLFGKFAGMRVKHLFDITHNASVLVSGFTLRRLPDQWRQQLPPRFEGPHAGPQLSARSEGNHGVLGLIWGAEKSESRARSGTPGLERNAREKTSAVSGAGAGGFGSDQQA